MKYKFLKIIILTITITSCQTTYTSLELNWPELSPIHWRSITVAELDKYKQSKIDLFKTNGNNESALYFAAQYSNNIDVIKYLLDEGLSVNQKSIDGNTPLTVAPLNSNSNAVSTLLEHNGDVHILNNFGIDPLGVAFLYGSNSKSIIYLLINYNKDTKGLRDSATSFMKSILDNNVDLQNIPNERSLSGYTPEMFAVQYSKSLNVQRRVIINSNKIDARDSKKWSLGTLAAIYTDYPEIIDLISSRGGNFNPVSDNKISAFMLACAFNRNIDVIKKLIDLGADINKQSSDGFTPLMFACLGNDNDEIISLLLNNGADPKIKNSYGETALDLILKNSRLIGSNGYWDLNDYMANNQVIKEK